VFIPSQRAIPFWFMLQLVVLDRWFFRLVPLPVQQVRFSASLSDSQIKFESRLAPVLLQSLPRRPPLRSKRWWQPLELGTPFPT